MGGAPSRETLIRSPVREPNAKALAGAPAGTAGLLGAAAAASNSSSRHNEVILIPLIPEYFPNFSCPAFQQLAAVYREPSNQFYYRDRRHTCCDVNAISEAARHSDKELYKLYMGLANQRLVDTDSELVALHRAGRVFTPVPCAVAFVYDVSRVAAQSLGTDGSAGAARHRKGGGRNGAQSHHQGTSKHGGGGGHVAPMTYENTVRIAPHNIRVRIFGFIGDVEFCPASMPLSTALKSPMEFALYVSKGAGGNYRAQVALFAAYTYMTQLRRIGIQEDWSRPMTQRSLSLFQSTPPSGATIADERVDGLSAQAAAGDSGQGVGTSRYSGAGVDATVTTDAAPDPYADPYANPLQDPYYYYDAYSSHVDPYQVTTAPTAPIDDARTSATVKPSDASESILDPRSDINSKQFTIVENAHLANNDNTVLPRSVKFRIHRTDVPGLCFLRELRAHMHKSLERTASTATTTTAASTTPPARSTACTSSSSVPPPQCALSAAYCQEAIRTVIDEEVLRGVIRADYTDRFLLWAAWFYEAQVDDFDGGEAARFRQELAQRNLRENTLDGSLFISAQQPGRVDRGLRPKQGDVWITSEKSYYYAGGTDEWVSIPAGEVLRYCANSSSSEEATATGGSESDAHLLGGQWFPSTSPKEYPEDLLLSLCRHACHVARRASPHDDHWVINPDLQLPEGIVQGLLVWREKAAGQVVSYAITPDFLKKWIQSGVDPAETYKHQVHRNRRPLLAAIATATSAATNSNGGATSGTAVNGGVIDSANSTVAGAAPPHSSSGSIGCGGVGSRSRHSPSLTEERVSLGNGGATIRTSLWQQLSSASLASSPTPATSSSRDIYNAQSGFVSTKVAHDQPAEAERHIGSHTSHGSGAGTSGSSPGGAQLTGIGGGSGDALASGTGSGGYKNSASLVVPTRSAAMPTGRGPAAHPPGVGASSEAVALGAQLRERSGGGAVALRPCGTPLPSPSSRAQHGDLYHATSSFGYGTSGFTVEEDRGACIMMPAEMADPSSTAMPINVTIRSRGGMRTPLSSYNSSLCAAGAGGLVGSLGSMTGMDMRRPPSGSATPTQGTPTHTHLLRSTPRGDVSLTQHSPYYYHGHELNLAPPSQPPSQTKQFQQTQGAYPQQGPYPSPTRGAPQSMSHVAPHLPQNQSSQFAQRPVQASNTVTSTPLLNPSTMPISIASKVSSSEENALKRGGHSPRSAQQHSGLLHSTPVTASSFGGTRMGTSGGYQGSRTSLLAQSYTDTRRLGAGAAGSSFKATNTSHNTSLLSSGPVHSPHRHQAGGYQSVGPQSSAIRVGGGVPRSPYGLQAGSADGSAHLFEGDRDAYSQLHFSPSNLATPGLVSAPSTAGHNHIGSGGDSGRQCAGGVHRGSVPSGSYSQNGELSSSYSQLRVRSDAGDFGYAPGGSRRGSGVAADLEAGTQPGFRKHTSDSDGLFVGCVDCASKMTRKEKVRPPPLLIPNTVSGHQ